MKYRADIDGLRAIAVMSVIFYHSGWSWIEGGFVGVDIFFVISGFLITHSLSKEFNNNKTINLKKFYLKRIQRLLPALLSVIFSTFLIGTFILSPGHLRHLGKSIISSIFSFSNILFWREADYFDSSTKLKPLLHTWSLSVEEQFYLIWPLLLLFTFKFLRKDQWKWFLFFIGLISLYINLESHLLIWPYFSVRLDSLLSKYSDAGASIFYLTPFRVFEFTIGALLVWLPANFTNRRLLSNFFSGLGFAGLGFSIFFFKESMNFPSYNALIPCISAALIIGCGRNSFSNGLLSSGVFAWVGRLSYSLYLVHWPLVAFCYYIFHDLSTLNSLIIIAITFFLAFYNHKLIENKYRYMSFKIFKPRCIGVVISLLLISLSAFLTNGWTWRVRSVRHAINGKDFHRKYYGGYGFKDNKSFTDNGPANIIIVGDSHGRQYATGFNEVLVKSLGRNMILIPGASCFRFKGYSRETKGRDWDTDCPKAFSLVMKSIAESEKGALVVMGHSWLSQMSRGKILKKSNPKVLVEDIVASILEFREMIPVDKKLIVFGEVPTTRLGFQLQNEALKPRLIRVDIDKFKFSSIQLFKKRIDFNLILKKSLRNIKGITFLNPFDVLCHEKLCQNYSDEDEFIYSDSSHLSKFGSRLVIKGFEDKIIPLLRQK